MNLPWLISVAVLTQAPDGFLERPDVAAYVDGPLVQYERYVPNGKGWVAGIQTQYNVAPYYFVLDARGRLDAAATHALRLCLPVPVPSAYPTLQIARLAAGRGVVVASACLLSRDQALPVAEVYGPSWGDLVSTIADSQPPREVVATFRKSDEYRKAAPPSVPPQVDVVALPNSPWELVLVSLGAVDPLALRPPQKVFVQKRGGKKTDRALTEALAQELRREHVSACGAGMFTLQPTAGAIIVSTDGDSEWRGDGGCSSLLVWDAAAKRLLIDAHDLPGRLEAEARAEFQRKHREAMRLFERGELEAAIAKWKQVRNQIRDDGEGAELCRGLVLGYARLHLEKEMQEELRNCSGLTTNRGELFLTYARLLQSKNEPAAALARYEQALEAPLGDDDRLETQRAIRELELQLAEQAQHAGQLHLARFHYEQVLRGPLTAEQAARVREQLRSVR